MMRRAFASALSLRSNAITPKRFTGNKVIDVDDAVHLIKNGSTLTVGGFVSMGTAEEVLAALGRRFEETGEPKDLTLVFQGGPGDWDSKGLNHLAKPGMVRRTIGSHYGQTPMLGKLALAGSIESYNLPMGAVSRMIRCAATGQPAHITEIGTGTMVDPAHGGGKINSNTKEDIVTEIEVFGKRYLAYKAIPIDVAIVRGSFADPDGNITFTREALYNENLLQAMAARARRGVVIAQVEHIAARGSLNPRDVLIPGTMVDCVVRGKPENHTMGYFHGYDPTVTGEIRAPPKQGKPMPLNIRKLIARRAALEILPNMVVNLGIGMPEGVALVAEEEGCMNYIELTTEPGIHGGVGLSGHNFGPARNYSALLTMDHQFDFYNGGGLDIAFLGNAETDQHGNVNVTRMAGKLTGPGGFVDITQSTHRVNLLGTFTAGGLEVEVTEEGKLKIVKEGRIKKFIKNVQEISFSGEQAQKKKQFVNYITERCVFNLTANGMELVEIAPGVDLQKDILDQMEFKPIIREPLRTMDPALYTKGLMKLRQRNFGGSLDMENRVFTDHKTKTVYVDLYNVNIRTEAQIETFESYLKGYIVSRFPEEKKADVVVTYDGFDLNPDLVPEFRDMQKRLGEVYKSIRRYSTGIFRRHKVAQALGVVTAAPKGDDTMPTTLNNDLSKSEVVTYFKRVGVMASSEAIENLYVKMFGNADTVSRAEVTKMLAKLLN